MTVGGVSGGQEEVPQRDGPLGCLLEHQEARRLEVRGG